MTNGSSASTETDIKHLRDEMAKLNKDLSHIGDTLNALLRHGKEEAIDGIADAADGIRKEVTRRAKSVTKEIEDKPLTAALIAFGIGLALGMIFRRR